MTGIVRTRMYRSFAAMWQGWTKNLYPLFGGTLGEFALEIDAASPWLGLLLGAVFGWELLRCGRRTGCSSIARGGLIPAALGMVRGMASTESLSGVVHPILLAWGEHLYRCAGRVVVEGHPWEAGLERARICAN